MTSPSAVDFVDMEELLLPIIERLEKKDFNLPTLPQIANQVLALTTDPEANTNELITLIQQDPILTAKIFKTANSAGCGPHRQIESLQQAVTWLGLNSVAGMAFALRFNPVCSMTAATSPKSGACGHMPSPRVSMPKSWPE